MPLPSFLVRWLFGPEPAPPEAPALPPEPEAEPPAPRAPLDAGAAFRAWVAADEELAGLYRSLGVQPGLEEACRQLLARAKLLLKVELPDPPAFLEALERLAGSAEPSFEAAWALRRADPLLLDVLALRHDLPALLARLEQRPVDELLPFLEEIPARRGGEVVWRLPRELALLRRRPARLEEFLGLLAELGSAVRRASLERPAELREAFFESLARTERDAADPAIYLPSSLRTLEEKLGEWLAAPSAEGREKRRALDAFLLDLIALRYALEDRRSPAGPAAESPAVLRARALAAGAIRSGFPLAAPSLLSALLHLLLLAELADRAPGSGPATATLEAIAAETAGGYFDPAETARRLRALESHDCWVFSPIFALLRLAAPPGAGI